MAEMPFDRAGQLFSKATGVSYSEGRMHDLLEDFGEQLTLEQVIPSKQDIENRIDTLPTGSKWRPVLMVATDGAHSPIRPPGKRNEKRGKSDYNEAKRESSLLYTDEEKEIKKKGLEKRYIFAKRRVKMLNDFKVNYKKLLPVMERAKDSINRFIFVVEESSYVYRDAYKTLKMQKDINNAYRTIKELQSLDYLSENIMKSWTDLENIIDTLTNQIEKSNYSSSDI